MKIEIIDVDYKAEADIFTLRECGFQIGDVVEVASEDPAGIIYAKAIRATDEVYIVEAVGLQECEYKVVE